MTDSSSTSTDAPRAHEGSHYANPQTKPLRGPAPTEREGVQRTVWKLFFVLIAIAIGVAIVLGLDLTRQ